MVIVGNPGCETIIDKGPERWLTAFFWLLNNTYAHIRLRTYLLLILSFHISKASCVYVVPLQLQWVENGRIFLPLSYFLPNLSGCVKRAGLFQSLMKLVKFDRSSLIKVAKLSWRVRLWLTSQITNNKEEASIKIDTTWLIDGFVCGSQATTLSWTNKQIRS